MAEIEINVLIRRCLDRRIDAPDEMRTEVQAWQRAWGHRTIAHRLAVHERGRRIKLKRLYPTLDT